MTTSTDNGDRVGRLFDGVWNGEDPGVADELVDPAYVIHDRELAEELRGPELYRALADGTRAVFPDMRFAVDDVLVDDDRVAVRWTMTGTHQGPMFGLEPTGREVRLPGLEIDRFEEGRLVETWTRSDMLGLAEQLGAVPWAGESSSG